MNLALIRERSAVNADVPGANTRNLMTPLHHQVSGSRPRQKRVKALVDCRAVGSEQLDFYKDEVIVVTATEDPHWWVSITQSPEQSLRFSRGQTQELPLERPPQTHPTGWHTVVV